MTVFAYNLFTNVELLCARLSSQVERGPGSGDLPAQTRFVDRTDTTPSTESTRVDHDRSVGRSTEAAAAEEADRGNALMVRLQQGDRRALPEMCTLYNGRLYAFLLRIVHDRETAEDIVQETWLAVWESRQRYETTYRFSTWLFTIARRKALSEIRRRKVRSIVRSLRLSRPGEEETQMEVPQDTFRQPDVEASGALLAGLIEKALDRLTPAQREIVMLRDVEGLENDEVAAVLEWDIRPGAVRKRIFDARAAFRREIERLGVDDYSRES